MNDFEDIEMEPSMPLKIDTFKLEVVSFCIQNTRGGMRILFPDGSEEGTGPRRRIKGLDEKINSRISEYRRFLKSIDHSEKGLQEYRRQSAEIAISLLADVARIELDVRWRLKINEDIFSTKSERKFFLLESPPDSFLKENDFSELRSRFEAMREEAELERSKVAGEKFSITIGIAKTWLESFIDTKFSNNRLTRQIVFPPEFHQAGVGILSYFAKIIENKYPEMEVGVSIRQDGNLVTMIIDHPDGKREEISKTLNEYMLVVSGDKPVNEFTDDRLQATALNIKLEQAKSEVRQTYMLLESERAASAAQIETLKESAVRYEANFSRIFGLLENAQSGEHQMRDALINLAVNSGHGTADILAATAKLAEAIGSRNSAKVEAIVEELRSSKPDVLTRMTSFISSSAVSGAIGNAAYGWLCMLWPFLPK